MKYCKRCVIPDTRPGIKFDKHGVCYPCLAAAQKKDVDWDKREEELKKLVKKYKRTDGYYDCIIAVSGGKDSTFQTFIMKKLMGMNPLLVSVTDPFTHTEAGKHNLQNLSKTFGCDMLVYNLNEQTTKKMIRIAFEEFGHGNYPIDVGIYVIPLKIAHYLGIPLVVYGENVSLEYGGPYAEETYSAKNQIKNNVLTHQDWNWWFARGVDKSELEFLRYPTDDMIEKLEPIYLSYFYPWDGISNYELAKRYGFRDLSNEWNRKGFIEDYIQVDSVGYLVNCFIKYAKQGHGRATEVACYLIRNGYITREEGIELVKKYDGQLDQKALDDFLRVTEYTDEEFWDIMDKIFNQDLFEFKNNKWVLIDPVWK